MSVAAGPGGLRLDELRAADLMTEDVVTVTEGTGVLNAGELMRQGGFRHLPVLRAGRVVGIVEAGALWAALGGLTYPSMGRPVAEVMVDYAARVSPEASLPEVAGHLRSSQCDAVLVTEPNGSLIGIITAHDLVRVIALCPVPSCSVSPER